MAGARWQRHARRGGRGRASRRAGTTASTAAGRAAWRTPSSTTARTRLGLRRTTRGTLQRWPTSFRAPAPVDRRDNAQRTLQAGQNSLAEAENRVYWWGFRRFLDGAFLGSKMATRVVGDPVDVGTRAQVETEFARLLASQGRVLLQEQKEAQAALADDEEAPALTDAQLVGGTRRRARRRDQPAAGARPHVRDALPGGVQADRARGLRQGPHPPGGAHTGPQSRRGRRHGDAEHGGDGGRQLPAGAGGRLHDAHPRPRHPWDQPGRGQAVHPDRPRQPVPPPDGRPKSARRALAA